MKNIVLFFLLTCSIFAYAGELFEDNGLVYRINDSDTNTVCLVYTAIETNNLTVPSTVNYNGHDKIVTEIGDTEDLFGCVIENNDWDNDVYLQLPKTIKRLNSWIIADQLDNGQDLIITFEPGNEVEYINNELCINDEGIIPFTVFYGLCAGENFKFPTDYPYEYSRDFSMSPKNKYYEVKHGCVYVKGLKSSIVTVMPTYCTDTIIIPKEVTNIAHGRLGCIEDYWDESYGKSIPNRTYTIIENGSQLKTICNYSLSYCDFQNFIPLDCKCEASFSGSYFNCELTLNSFDNYEGFYNCTFKKKVILNCGILPQPSFYRCSFNDELIFTNSVKTIKNAAFQESSYNKRIIFPENIGINSHAFYKGVFNQGFSMKNCKSYTISYDAFEGAVAFNSPILRLKSELKDFTGEDIDLFWDADNSECRQHHEGCYHATLPHVTTLHFTTPKLNHISLLYGSNSHDLKRVVLALATPPSCPNTSLVSEEYTKPHTEVIDGKTHYFPSAYDKVIIYVPKGSLEAYKNSQYWKKFTHIIEYDTDESINYNYEILGDTNLDGITDVKDITRLIACIIGGENDNSGFADVNNDGEIDVQDVTALINLILN